MVREFDAGEARARQGRSSGLWRRRRGSAGVSERARGHQQVKAGAWARCQATAAARRATPACGRHAAEVFCRGRGVARRPAGERRGVREKGQRAELGWAEAMWAGAGEARGARLAGTRTRPASADGPETRRKAHEGKNKIFQINLNSFFIQTNFWTKSKQFQTLGQK